MTLARSARTPESHTYFVTRFCVPNSHTFCENQA
jgi:hypothetical protein